jgi:hypothetical protein
LSGLAPQIISSSFQAVGSNHWQANFTANAGDPLQSSLPLRLAWLNFNALSNAHSAIVSPTVSDVVGSLPNGTALANPRVSNGRVFLIGREPILDAHLSSNQVRLIDLYGHPNRRYLVQFTTNLLDAANWVPFQEIDMESSSTRFSSLPVSIPIVFYRAREVGLIVPLSIQRAGESVVIEWPVAAGNCVLEKSTSLDALTTWSPVSTVPQLAGEKYRLIVPATGRNTFFRLWCVE